MRAFSSCVVKCMRDSNHLRSTWKINYYSQLGFCAQASHGLDLLVEVQIMAEHWAGDPYSSFHGTGLVVLRGLGADGNQYHVKLQCSSNCFDEHDMLSWNDELTFVHER